MSDGYGSYYKDVEAKKSQADEYKQEAVRQQRLAESHMAEVNKPVPRRRYTTSEFGTPFLVYKTRMERKRVLREKARQAAELGRAISESKQYQSDVEEYKVKLGEQEAKVKQYEKEGYKLAVGDEGKLAFSKQVTSYKTVSKKVKVKVGGGTPVVSQRVRWVTSEGVSKSVLTQNVRVPSVVKYIESKGGRVTGIESLAAPESKSYQYTYKLVTEKVPVTTTVTKTETKVDTDLKSASPFFDVQLKKWTGQKPPEVKTQYIGQDKKSDIVFTSISTPVSNVKGTTHVSDVMLQREIKVKQEEEKRLRQIKEYEHRLELFDKRKSEIISASKSGDLKRIGAVAAAFYTSELLSWRDPFGLKSKFYAAEGILKGKPKEGFSKALDVKTSAMVDLDIAREKGIPHYAFKAYTGPAMVVGSSYAGGVGYGKLVAGIASVSPTGASMFSTGTSLTGGSMAAINIGSSAYEATQSGDWSDVFTKSVITGSSFGLGMAGARSVTGYKPMPKVHIKYHKDTGFYSAKKFAFEFPSGSPRFHYGKTIYGHQSSDYKGYTGMPSEPSITTTGIYKPVYTPQPESNPYAVVPYQSNVPSTQVGIKPVVGTGVMPGEVFYKSYYRPPYQPTPPTKSPQLIDYSKTPVDFRKPFSYRDSFPRKWMPDYKTHTGHPSEKTYTTDVYEYLKIQEQAGLTRIKYFKGVELPEFLVDTYGYTPERAASIGGTYARLWQTSLSKYDLKGLEVPSEITVRTDDKPGWTTRELLQHEALHLYDHTKGEPFAYKYMDKKFYFPKEPDPFLKSIKQFEASKTQLSTTVLPKPMSYKRVLGMGGFRFTPYTTTMGKGVIVKPFYTSIDTPKVKTMPSVKPFVRATDSTGKQIGHEFLTRDMKPLRTTKKLWWDKDVKEDYSLDSKQIRIPKESYDIGDVSKTHTSLRKNVLSKYIRGTQYLPKYDTYEGFPRETGTKMILRPKYNIDKRRLMWKDVIGKSLFAVKFTDQREPVIKSFRGFKGRKYSLKDLTKKWEMDKSDFDSTPIRMGGSTEQQILLKPPKTKTSKISKLKTDTKLSSKKTSMSTRSKVSMETLYNIGRFDLDVYYVPLSRIQQSKQSQRVAPLKMIQLPQQKQQQVQTPVFNQFQIQTPIQAQIQGSTQIQTPIQSQVTRSVSIPTLKQDFVSVPLPRQLYKQKTKTDTPIPQISLPGLKGKGKKGKKEFWKEKYKFRKFKIDSPFKEVKL